MDIFIIISIVVLWTISGFLSMDLQDKKGYDGGFLIGFFLGIFGLIYSAGLPDKSQRVLTSKTGKEKIIERVENAHADLSNYVLCDNCGFPIYDDESKCSNCGKNKKNNKM